MSAKQIQRQTGLSYKSALFLLHRVRFAMADMEGVKLSGTIEVDETYVGGKPRHKGNNKRGRGTKKTPVFGMVERNGRVKTQVVADVTGATLKGAIREVADNQSRIMTDENRAYSGIGAEFAGGHKFVTHSAMQYVNGDAHTNTIEGVFSLIKRGMYGIYHNVSKRHLHRYLAEYDFRWNNRKVSDGERTVAAIRGAEGKRLMYREPSSV
jgi:transposase-like protein